MMLVLHAFVGFEVDDYFATYTRMLQYKQCNCFIFTIFLNGLKVQYIAYIMVGDVE